MLLLSLLLEQGGLRAEQRRLAPEPCRQRPLAAAEAALSLYGARRESPGDLLVEKDIEDDHRKGPDNQGGKL